MGAGEFVVIRGVIIIINVNYVKSMNYSLRRKITTKFYVTQFIWKIIWLMEFEYISNKSLEG